MGFFGRQELKSQGLPVDTCSNGSRHIWYWSPGSVIHGYWAAFLKQASLVKSAYDQCRCLELGKLYVMGQDASTFKDRVGFEGCVIARM